MIARVISGGQTGVDQAGWRAAKAAGLPTAGWMPRGFLTEDGPRPEFAALYGAREHPRPEYPPRTAANVKESDATLWLGDGDSRGRGCTLNAGRRIGRPALVVRPGMRPSEVAAWLRLGGYKVVNVAGNRESSNPGIGARTERFLAAVFRLLKEGGAGDGREADE